MKAYKTLFLFVLLVLTLNSSLPAQQAAGAIKLVSREVSLGKLPPECLRETLVISPNARRMAYVVRRDNRYAVVVDGIAGKEYGHISNGAISFSPDSQHVAYYAMNGDISFMVYDDKESGPYERLGAPFFSRDGKHMAYGMRKGRSYYAVNDGKESAAFENLMPDTFLYSPDSAHLAFVAQRGNNFYVVADGVEGKPYSYCLNLTYSPDGRRFAYVAMKGKKAVVVADGVEGKEYDGAADAVFGKNLTEAMALQMINSLVVPFSESDTWTLQFSPDSKHLAYAARRGRKFVIVNDGIESPEFDSLGVYGALRFSPDSQHLAYLAKQGKKWVVVTDGVKGMEHSGSGAYGLTYSPDSKRLAYCVEYGGERNIRFMGENFMMDWKSGTWCVVVDGVEGKRYDAVLSAPMFSPDSMRMAYVANRKEKVHLVVDQTESAPFEYVLQGRPLFSPDSRHIAHMAKKGEQWQLIVDGTEGKLFNPLAANSRFEFDTAKSLHYVALLEQDVQRVETDISEEP